MKNPSICLSFLTILSYIWNIRDIINEKFLQKLLNLGLFSEKWKNFLLQLNC